MKENKRTGVRLIGPYIILIFIILAELIYTTYRFSSEKEGLHSDEIWCYGLANSYYQPFIYMQDGVFIEDMTEEDIINFNEWVSGDVFSDYVTVQEDERFSYASVYHNQTLDHHPPLYYMLLHTVCSFFPDSFSVYYAYFLNCIFLAITQLFLFKLSKLLLKSDNMALLVCILYGGGTGALSTFIFLRQYSLLTALTVMYTYFNAALFYSDGFNLKKRLPPIAVTAFSAFMTHYYAIAYIGVFTACFCIYFLCKKRFKKMFVYGGSILVTLLIYLLVYSAAFMQITSSEIIEDAGWDFWTQGRVLLNYIMYYNFGIYVSIYKSWFQYVIIAVVLSIVIISVPVCFLFRKEKWFIAKKNLVKEKLSCLLKWTPNFLKNASYIPLFILAAVIGEVSTANIKTDVLTMGKWSMRYIFCVFPLCCLLGFFAVRIILKKLVKPVLKRIPRLKSAVLPAAAAATAGVVLLTNYQTSCQFWFEQHGSPEEISGAVEGKNCLLIMSDYKSVWMLTNFSMYLKDADNVFVIIADDLENSISEIGSIEGGVDCVISTSANYALTQEQYDYFMDKYDAKTIKDEEISEKLMMSDDVDEMLLGEYEDCTQSVNSLAENLYPEYCLNINGAGYYVFLKSE